jgi:hypothetical protein
MNRQLLSDVVDELDTLIKDDETTEVFDLELTAEQLRCLLYAARFTLAAHEEPHES